MIIFLVSCQENKHASGIANNGSESLKTNEIQNVPVNANMEPTSVVSPIIPERTITVGGSAAEIQGFTSEAIQTAIEAIHSTSAGGTVKLLPGIYEIIAPVKLYDNMSLIGSGQNTILKKCKGFRPSFALDADYGELQITVTDPSGFKPGMGVAIYDDDHRS